MVTLFVSFTRASPRGDAFGFGSFTITETEPPRTPEEVDALLDRITLAETNPEYRTWPHSIISWQVMDQNLNKLIS